MYGKLSDAFDAVAVKTLSRVDTPKGGSHQHEIGGLVKAGLGTLLHQRSRGGTRTEFRGTYVSLSDDRGPIVSSGPAVWYDARAGKEGRGPEYRLYYKDNQAVNEFSEGDLLLVALSKKDELLLVCAPPDSESERQLKAVFGIESLLTSDRWTNARVDRQHVILPLESIFADVLEIELPGTASDEELTERLVEEFGDAFPPAVQFSAFARSTVQADPLADPDTALMMWQEQETHLFKLMEKHLLKDKFKELMTSVRQSDVDTDEYIQLSKSILNRRKARAGLGFQNHIEAVLKAHHISFTAQARTERKERPDFVFPSETAYQNAGYDVSRLRMLAAKTTLKERWSQVCREADRIQTKHIITIDASMTASLIEEITAHDLRLVVPSPLQELYRPQRTKMDSFAGFLYELKRLGHFDGTLVL